MSSGKPETATNRKPTISDFPCPHSGDSTHGGLGKGWCEAGREGELFLAELAARVAAFKEDRRG